MYCIVLYFASVLYILLIVVFLVSDNAVVSFVARHGVFYSRMFYYKHVIDKASTDGLDHSVQCCADLIRELVMVCDGLLVLSDSRIN